MKTKILLIAAMLFFTAVSGWPQTRLETGAQLLRQGKIDAALVTLRRLVKDEPKNISAWFSFGEACLRAGQTDSARWAEQQIRTLNAKAPEGFALLAKVHLAEKNFAEAREALKAGFKLNKQNAALLLTLGETLVASDSLDKAIVAFAQAAKAAPANPAPYEALGDIYLQQSGIGMAIISYEKAIALDSLNARLLHKFAKVYVSERQYNDAARVYQKVIQQDTTNHAAMFELAKLYFAAKKYANVAQLMPVYVRRNPDSSEAWWLYLDAVYLSKQYKEVFVPAQKILQIEPNSAKALRMIAQAHFEQREYDKVVTFYQKLRLLEPLPPDDLKRLGKAYVETKRDSLAALAWEEGIRSGGNGAEIYGELGVIYMRQRQFEKAATMFEKKFNQDSTSVSAYVNYALSNMALQKWEPARRALYHTLSLKSDYVQGYLFLARCLVQMDSLAQSKRMSETLVKLASKSAATYKTEIAEAQGIIGVAFLLDKKYPEAIEVLTASIKLVDNNPQTRLWRAQSYALAAKHEEAVAEYKVVLRLDPKNKEAKKNLALLAQ
jgi:tetratricopeptide (TPR) repeat protein